MASMIDDRAKLAQLSFLQNVWRMVRYVKKSFLPKTL